MPSTTRAKESFLSFSKEQCASLRTFSGIDCYITNLDGELIFLPDDVHARRHDFCMLIQNQAGGKPTCMQCHAQAGQRAFELGETYITRCHAGAIMLSAPLVYGGEHSATICSGPFVMWEWDDLASNEIAQRVAPLNPHPEVLENILISAQSLNVLTAKRVNALADILYAVSAAAENCERSVLHEKREKNRLQMQMANLIQETNHLDYLEEYDKTLYPLHMEKELLSRVRIGDRSGARGILNDLLGQIFFRTAGNMDIMKARILEIVVMISRAAVESGASLDKLLGLNYNFIVELSGLTRFEDVCLWVVQVLDVFMDTVYAIRNSKNPQFLGEALNYIRSNYTDNLSLDEVASQVHVSPYYLSHMFKEELNINFVEYLTRIRIEEAKRLLHHTKLSIQQIAAEVGYDDPSYFSKVFKKSVGQTPNQYRKPQKP